MEEEEHPWKKFIRAKLKPGDTYASAMKTNTDIDPEMQEFLDIERLFATANSPDNDDVFAIAALRLREIVVSILCSKDANTHRGFGYALAELTWLKMIYPNDHEVQDLYKEYLAVSGKD